jgi:hypothetical protein
VFTQSQDHILTVYTTILILSQTHPHTRHSSMCNASNLAYPLRPFRPDGARDLSIRLPGKGELIMIRLNFSMGGPASIISESAISGSTGANYHPCLVAKTSAQFNRLLRVNIWSLKVYICRSYSSVSDGVAYINSLPESARKHFIPLPFHPRPDTPTEFGSPLSIPGYLARRPTWLLAIPATVIPMGHKPVCYSLRKLRMEWLEWLLINSIIVQAI